jgi:hypothetical protein
MIPIDLLQHKLDKSANLKFNNQTCLYLYSHSIGFNLLQFSPRNLIDEPLDQSLFVDECFQINTIITILNYFSFFNPTSYHLPSYSVLFHLQRLSFFNFNKACRYFRILTDMREPCTLHNFFCDGICKIGLISL